MLTPKDNTKLFGHEEAEAGFLRDFSSGKLAHGWIISGPRGIGKGTLAYRFARKLLGGGEKTAARILAGSHSDLLVIEPLYDAKKEEHARELSVEQARTIGQFLSLTPGESDWRIVIINSADALNTNAANAILKILEEPPPQSVILLISHNPSKLLPTIRSRCRMLRLKPLNENQFNSAMSEAAPDIEMDELATLAELSDYSPGIALQMHEDGAVEIYEQLLKLVSNPEPLKIHAFADKITAGQTHANWQMLTRLMLHLFESITKQAIGIDGKLIALHPPHIWAAKWQQAADQFSLADRLHLDYKQVIITFIHSIASKEGFQLGNTAA